MAAGHRQMRDFANAVADALFMIRIPNGEVAGNGEGGDLAGKRRQRGIELAHVEWGFAAVHIVAARQEDHRIGAQRLQETIALQIVGAKADHDKTGAAALPFDERIGRKRRRQRDHADCRNRHFRLIEHRFDRAGNTDCEVVAGRQRRGFGDHPLRFREESGVGIGAAGVDAEKKMRGQFAQSGIRAGRKAPGSMGIDAVI
ncbi:hypothetical protein D9M70_401950 [compost metagenome]